MSGAVVAVLALPIAKTTGWFDRRYEDEVNLCPCRMRWCKYNAVG